MPLLAFWNSNPDEVAKLSIEQVVSSAGDGVLRDNSLCSSELREYLAQIVIDKLFAYVEHCLSSHFNKSGLVLQDLVNELGRRLGYDVENGKYQGTVNGLGFDGLWSYPGQNCMIVEVKTTDAYRINLDRIATYRGQLINAGKITGSSSILIVVGRDDTGELEAQVRGSRHAWDIRLISTDALTKLVYLRQNTESTDTDKKIRGLLIPMEYTRLDNIIDLMFATAADVEATTAAPAIEPTEAEQTVDAVAKSVRKKGVFQFTESHLLAQKRDEIVSTLNRHFGQILIRKRGAYYSSAQGDKRVICTISKNYEEQGHRYWYGYHSEWQEFLIGHDGYLALGCMDLTIVFAIPATALTDILSKLNTTMLNGEIDYWHLRLIEISSGSFALSVPNGHPFMLDQFKVSFDQ